MRYTPVFGPVPVGRTVPPALDAPRHVRFALLILAGILPAAIGPVPTPGPAAGAHARDRAVEASDTLLNPIRFHAPRGPVVHLGLTPLPLPWPTVQPPAMPDRFPDPFPDPTSRARVFARSAAEVIARGSDVTARRPAVVAVSPRPLPPAVAARPADERSDPVQALGGIARSTQLGMRVVGRTEMGGDWSRFRPCEQRLRESCTPTLVPRLEPDLRFGIQVGGTIADRVTVDVDYDQMREFEAANTINIQYLGGVSSIVRRLEVGDVTFRLPPSRFLTQGLPAGNFGFQAEGRLGPLDLQAVWAEQKGDLSSREFRLTGVGSDRGFVQEDTLVLDDADYVRGQFFFLVDPRAIQDYPHLDLLTLDGSTASPFVTPGPGAIQLYRFENDPLLRQQVEGFIQADAVAGLGADSVRESGWFRYLQPGLDYFVHPSGLWIALKNPLARDEMLAVTFITAAGDMVGTYNPEHALLQGRRPTLRLLKASNANHQPGRPTWEMELHNFYRVSGSGDVDPGSVDLTISLGEKSAGRTFKHLTTGGDISFLRLFGLDEESPLDRIDLARVYSASRDVDLFGDQPAVQGTFLVFPTLRPFREPPPVPSLRLSAAETGQILGPDSNDRIYDARDLFERDNGGLFRLTIPYRVRSEGLISSFALGALGLRDQSERIWLGERLLVKNVDYTIDYDVGQVTLLDAETLFSADPDGVLRATWEAKQIFRTAPTSVAGLRATYGLGQRGSLDVLGLYRSEQTLVNRPQLGVEPGGIGLGGLNGRYLVDAGWIDRFLARLPGLRSSGGSVLSLTGEMALSLPNPNLHGDVFLDDFDATAALPLSLLAQDWVLASAPSSSEGAEHVLPAALGPEDAAPLVWQHAWVLETVAGDSAGVHEGFLPRLEIDRQIRVSGSEIREPGLLLTFGKGAAFGEQRFRSITTQLAPTGVDLTKTEFLEMYVAGDDQTSLVLDLGVVSEDALFIDDAGRTQGFKPNGDQWGLGLLDQEADPARGEIWSDLTDRAGVWGETCVASPQAIYRIGDPRADCTRENGRRDSEDLDGNGNLGTSERYLRFVVELGVQSPYLVRTTSETETPFRLYRVPILDPRAQQVGGTITEADLRAVKHLRVTVASRRPTSVTLARMGLVGSRWIKRAGEGVLAGMIGDTLASGFGRLEVGSVSRVTEGSAYESPPRVLEQLSDPTLAFGGQGVEFNEKGLGLRFDDLGTGERAEVYQRFPQQPRDFLEYREARLWVVPRFGDFGSDRPRYFYFRVGKDTDNFYLYRTRLGSPSNPAGVTQSDWLPEVVVDFEEWETLRVRAEQWLSRSPRAPGAPPVQFWSADSTYAVVLRDRGRGPDLANVREMSVGVWNDGAPFSGEIWVDELRLSRGVRTPGGAGHLDLDLSAADFADVRLTLRSRGANFRQLEERPSYQTDQLLTLASVFRLDRFLPGSWGVDLPLIVSHDQTALDPTYLPNSDVRADLIQGLRTTGSDQTRVSLGFRKRTPSGNPIVGALLDGIDAQVGWYGGSNGSITSDQRASGVDARLGYARALAVRDFPLLPSFLEGVARAILPRFLEEPVVGARLRWSPERFSLGSAWNRQDATIIRFDRIIATPADSAALPTELPRQAMETAAELRLRPLPSLTADFTVLTDRDLLDPERAVTDPELQALLARERGGIAGLDLGWETHRDLRTRITFRPQLTSWLRYDVTWSTRYLSDRNATFARRTASGGDTLGLPRTADGQRDVRSSLALDPRPLAGTMLATDPTSILALFLRGLRPLSVVWQDGVASRFHQDVVDPGTAFQLGWGEHREFRYEDGDTAAFVTDRRTVTLGSGLAFGPFATDVGWARTRGTTLDTRSDRSILIDTWPDVRVSIRDLRIPGSFRVTLGSGAQLVERRTVFGGGQVMNDEDLQIPADLTITWAGDASLSYRGAFRTGEGRDPTGETERGRANHRVALSSTVMPPAWLPIAFDRPLRLALVWGLVAERDCRRVAGRPSCVAFVDQINRSLNLSVDTRVSGLEMGLNASFVNRQSFIGQRSGSTQLQLGLFGQFTFEAGELPIRPIP